MEKPAIVNERLTGLHRNGGGAVLYLADIAGVEGDYSCRRDLPRHEVTIGNRSQRAIRFVDVDERAPEIQRNCERVAGERPIPVKSNHPRMRRLDMEAARRKP